MIHDTPYCSSAPTGSETSANPSRPAPTTPNDPSIQDPLRTPCAISSMSSAIHTPAHGSSGCDTRAATNGFAVTAGHPPR
jgi:hypothetical protein